MALRRLSTLTHQQSSARARLRREALQVLHARVVVILIVVESQTLECLLGKHLRRHRPVAHAVGVQLAHKTVSRSTETAKIVSHHRSACERIHSTKQVGEAIEKATVVPYSLQILELERQRLLATSKDQKRPSPCF